MKRITNVFEHISNVENLMIADEKARRHKTQSYGVRVHDKNRKDNLNRLSEMLSNQTYRTSPYDVFKIYKPKERHIYRLPYFPDRIVHHAVMNVLQDMFVKSFTSDTYSCIPGRGIHLCMRKLRDVLREDSEGTKYCLKIDIKKFYPSVNHKVLKSLLRRKIKDKELLWLLDEIIESAKGLPIGNYLSQYLSNFYLTYFDHWLKEELKVKYYFRYADDMVFLADNKRYLHELLNDVEAYLKSNLKLTVKENRQVFPVQSRGIDFVGYRFYHTHVGLRKSIKKSFAKAVKKNKSRSSIQSYKGWAVHCDSKHLLKKLNV